MRTEILPIDEKSLRLAKAIIDCGGAVAFPTETVYGLGVNAYDAKAIENVFAIKGRPNDNPLIVHIHKDYDLFALVTDVPEYAKRLAKAYLPGPLTMIFKSSNKVCPAVSCGLDTLAIRIPSHIGAQEFLKYLNLPIAAPSANISKHVSPVTAQHVLSDLGGRIGLILDGGKCNGGIESTVIDCTGEKPQILRSGLITREMIEAVVGSCEDYVLKDGEKARSPGMKYKHYSPTCRTMLFDFRDLNKAVEEYEKSRRQGINAYIMCDDETAEIINVYHVLKLGKTGEQIASNLYEKLREGEIRADLIIAIAPVEQGGVMKGVMNRLVKACGS